MYRSQYQPVSFRHPALQQTAAPAAPAGIDTTKVVKGALTLGVLGTSAYAGFKLAQNSKKTSLKVAGYVGGIGSLLVGLAVVANAASMPDVTQTLTRPFTLQVA